MAQTFTPPTTDLERVNLINDFCIQLYTQSPSCANDMLCHVLAAVIKSQTDGEVGRMKILMDITMATLVLMNDDEAIAPFDQSKAN